MSNVSELYERMFEAKKRGDQPLADFLMNRIESERLLRAPGIDAAVLNKVVEALPDFARSVLGKNHIELGLSDRSNCINASFNFHFKPARYENYSTMEFLNIIKSEFTQVTDEYCFGDLAVSWSRTGGSWDSRKIVIAEINPNDSDFPYGLVFDHVAVRVAEDLVFHKADPTLESRYRLDTLESAMSVTKGVNGFEMTFHRARN